LARASGADPPELIIPATPVAHWRGPHSRAMRVITIRISSGRLAKSASDSHLRTPTSSPAPIRLWIETAPVQPT